MNEIRQKNKELGRTCGNCGLGSECCDKKRVVCGFLASKMPNQNEMLWYRKNKGGCGHWTQKGEMNNDKERT